MSSVETRDVSAAVMCPVTTADICPVSTEDIYPVSTEDIYLVSTVDMTAASLGLAAVILVTPPLYLSNPMIALSQADRTRATALTQSS